MTPPRTPEPLRPVHPTETAPPARAGRAVAGLYLVAAAPIQVVGTWLAMVAYPDAGWAKASFAAAKVTLLLVPVLWLLHVERRRPRIPRWSNRGMVAAHVTGALIFVIIAAGYYAVGRHWIDAAAMRRQVTTNGLGVPALFLLGALYWCTINSILEEYFWRWFIGERLRDVLPRTAAGSLAAAVGSALLFTAHHVVALATLVDVRTTIAASIGVFIGGLTWSLLYLRHRNIYACWVSHVYADIIIFYLGYRIVFG